MLTFVFPFFFSRKSLSTFIAFTPILHIPADKRCFDLAHSLLFPPLPSTTAWRKTANNERGRCGLIQESLKKLRLLKKDLWDTQLRGHYQNNLVTRSAALSQKKKAPFPVTAHACISAQLFLLRKIGHDYERVAVQPDESAITASQ